ncbi:Embigin Precursor [Larimichthys crocea]|uniref:Embigin n=1 Tax=Larimichthys crocea TaxID=215358 RepID=A0A6G0IKK6_LARCR|nr:Embigin Precursor [Larimichthys crocea]
MLASWKQLIFQILLLLISCRHINTTSPDPTPPPLVPIDSLPRDVRRAAFKGEGQIEKVELLNPVNLELVCTWTGHQNKESNITGFWRKDGLEIENSHLTVQLENEQYQLQQVFNIVSEENLGNYSCVFESEVKIDFVVAVPQIGEIRDKPVVTYVGDSGVITCKMEDSKPMPNTWKWYKANGTDKEEIFAAAEPQRYEIKNNERKTKLLVNNLTMADSGLYYCGAVYTLSTSMGHVELKVITYYEPLKPFMAIVAEVFILVTAILLFERSRSKKNDTEGDMMSDQTNTLSPGENNGLEGSSSMRQRKT